MNHHHHFSEGCQPSGWRCNASEPTTARPPDTVRAATEAATEVVAATTEAKLAAQDAVEQMVELMVELMAPEAAR